MFKTLDMFVYTPLFIDACRPNPCYRGVDCLNEPDALHLHRCGPCPVGMSGDGTYCEPVNEVSTIISIHLFMIFFVV